MKVGQRVQLIKNGAGSAHPIGTTGTIREVRSGSMSRADYYIYLIENDRGYCSRTGTWSFKEDLKLLSPVMHKNTKTL